VCGLVLVDVTDETLLPDTEDAAQQIQSDLKHKIKQIPLNRNARLGTFAPV
jgi:hypothetical protein